jgi:hypothetical protein
MIAIFNDYGDFLGYSSILPPNIKNFKDLGESFDLNKQFWFGDFFTGELKNIEDSKINEFELESELFNRIYEKYSIEYIQLILIKQLKETTSKNSLQRTKEFELILNEIDPILNEYDKFLKDLTEKNKIETKKDIYEKNKRIFGL